MLCFGTTAPQNSALEKQELCLCTKWWNTNIPDDILSAPDKSRHFTSTAAYKSLLNVFSLRVSELRTWSLSASCDVQIRASDC